MKFSLKWKIILNMWLLAAVCTLTAQALGSWLLIKNQEKNIEQHLRSTATTLMSLGISDFSGLQGFQKLNAFIEENLKIEKIHQIIQVYTKRGKLMFTSISPVEVGFSIHFLPTEKPMFSLYRLDNKKYKVLTTPYKAKTGKTYLLQIAMPSPQYREIVWGMAHESLILFLSLSLVAFFISQILASKIVKPVKTIAMHLDRLNPSHIKDWEPLILPQTGEYLSTIISGINNLTLRIKNSLYRVSRTNRYLAHELRNPLTILTGEAEMVLSKKDSSGEEYRAVLESSLEEFERIQNVISTVSRLYTGERTIYYPTPCSVGLWLDKQIPHWVKFLGKPLLWEKPSEDILVVLDQDLLYRLIDNILRNIKVHTPKNTQTRIQIFQDHPLKRIIIEDNGPGMPTDFIEGLNSNNPPEDKIGIGLALCLEIAATCNFKLNFSSLTPQGLRVEIDLES